VVPVPTARARPVPALRFRRACTAAAAALPGPLAGVVAPSVVGFAVVSAFTFAVDLALLTVLHSALALPLPVAVSVAYGIALTLNFLLNRALTFDSRRRIGPAAGRYAAVVVVNYVVVVLGVTTVLDAVGVQYHLARVAAGLVELVLLYAAQRWFVFGSHPRYTVTGHPADP
jgi:putative flippase GtrA